MPAIREVIIIGSGPAGLTAGLYAARANLNPLLIDGDVPGGQLTTTTVVENYPGFVDGVDGFELIQNMTEQAKRFGMEIKSGVVKEVNFEKNPREVILTNGEIFQTKTLIISTGARPRKLEIPSEKKLWAKGVTSCATCDGYFYRGKTVCVIGGGDSAMEEASFLTKFCNKVYLIHRRDKFRASKIMAERVLNHPKIEVLWNSEVEEILGEEKVSGVRLRNVATNEVKEVALDGVFLAIGHIPNTDPFKGKLKMDKEGYILTENHSTATNIPGIFACGDCQDHIYRQAITAAGTGCMAAIEAERWIENNSSKF